MGQCLVIVESMAKSKTISRILGEKYIVMSSIGLIRDLPSQRLGVDIDNGFEPEYVFLNGKEKIVHNLKTIANQCDRVYIATDPDREGEIIAWHLREVLKSTNNNIQRIIVDEITKNAVREAIKRPLQINTAKVNSQKARCILDRLVEYKVSPTLWTNLHKGLSAERVQSVALRILCEREDKIEAFIPKEGWTITVEFQGKKTNPFFSILLKINDEKFALPDKYHAEVVVDDLKHQTFIVKEIMKKKFLRKPAPPFNTSTMLQEASKRLGFSSNHTMMIARQLYEGIEVGREGPVGLITFMRTESTHSAEEALVAVRELILTDYGNEYLPKTPKKYQTGRVAQDAHEAIRPTSMRRSPKSVKKFLTPEQFKLYPLICNRFVASQMRDAELEKINIDIVVDEGERYLLGSTGTVVIFRGFLQVYEDFKNEEEKCDSSYMPKNLREGEKLTLVNILPKHYLTNPPERYSESSLLQELDTRGIGRPDTYAQTINTLISQNYLRRERKQLLPTDLGRTVNKILVQNFAPVINVPFTAKMEDDLDRIESGERQLFDVVSDYYRPLNAALERLGKKDKSLQHSPPEEGKEKCPQCGKNIVLKKGRSGLYYGCEDFPKCRFSKSAEKDTAHINEKCEICGREMVVKVGRFGRFLACCGYPQCKNSKPFPIGVKCSKDGCDGDVIERKSGHGRLFYGCSRYPDCDFMSWQKPVGYRCLKCGNFYVESSYTPGRGEYLSCPKCKTEYDMNMVPLGEGVQEVEV